MSSSFPILPNGMFLDMASSVPPQLASPLLIREGMNPGAIALTVICLGAKSAANFFVSW